MRRSALLLALILLAGCAGDGRPRLHLGEPCTSCSMGIADLRFAAAQRVEGRWLAYDAIECLIRDAGANPGAVWLPDYDTRVLHPADSMWVVRGEFPTPMSGGFAAFVDRAAADTVAAETHGTVARFADWASRSPR